MLNNKCNLFQNKYVFYLFKCIISGKVWLQMYLMLKYEHFLYLTIILKFKFDQFFKIKTSLLIFILLKKEKATIFGLNPQKNL